MLLECCLEYLAREQLFGAAPREWPLSILFYARTHYSKLCVYYVYVMQIYSEVVLFVWFVLVWLFLVCLICVVFLCSECLKYSVRALLPFTSSILRLCILCAEMLTCLCIDT